MKKIQNKPWRSVFEVKVEFRKNDKFIGGEWVWKAEFGLRTSYGIYRKGTNQRVTDRWYSHERDAWRGAAQIYNAIEKALLK